MLCAGALGTVLIVHNFPVAPLLLAFVLSPTLEYNMRQAFVLSHGSVTIFFTKPISLFFLCVMFLCLILPLIKKLAELGHKKENGKQTN
jgi:putative tricarboxylic transport membrane protein